MGKLQVEFLVKREGDGVRVESHVGSGCVGQNVKEMSLDASEEFFNRNDALGLSCKLMEAE